MRNELYATVGRTTTEMNVHFVPRVFICLQAVSTGLQGPLAGFHACSTSRFSLSGFLRHGCKKISRDQRGVKLSIIPILLTKSSV